MISETELIDCENLPNEFRRAFDKAWHFVGDVEKNAWQPIACFCRPCDDKLTVDSMLYPQIFASRAILVLRPYRFVTGDLLLVTVFFGQCQTCQAVHWARSGPPFKRLRRYVPAGV